MTNTPDPDLTNLKPHNFNHMLDTMMNGMLMNHMISNDNMLSFGSIIKLFIMFCIQDIRETIIKVLSKIKDWIVMGFSKFVTFCRTAKSRRKPTTSSDEGDFEPQIKDPPSSKHLCVGIKFTINMLEQLLSDSLVNREKYSIQFINNQEHSNTQRVNQIQFCVSDHIKGTIYDPIEIQTKIVNGEVNTVSFQICNKTLIDVTNGDNVQRFTDLISDPMISTWIRQKANTFASRYLCTDVSIRNFQFINFHLGKAYPLPRGESVTYSDLAAQLLLMLKALYPNLELDNSMTELSIYLCTMHIVHPSFPFRRQFCCDIIKKILNGETFNHEISGLHINPPSKLNPSRFLIEGIPFSKEWDGYTTLGSYNVTSLDKEMFAPIVTRFQSKTSPNDKDDDTCIVNLESDIESEPDQLYGAFENYMLKLLKRSNQVRDQIKVYQLKVEWDEQTESEPNPEFIEFSERMSIMRELMSPPTDKKEGNVNESKVGGTSFEFMSQLHIPSKTIERVKIVPRVSVTLANSFFKNIDTLYLRQHDLDCLRTALECFRERQDIYRELGLPKKLGFLLHGVPGTGKSTTIIAIASYFRKDIYYVDLSGITKNSELQMIFDYVIKNNNNGGIIVFEDIDATTSIVLRRDQKFTTEQTLSHVMNSSDESLNLSYFLNILDGTLCADGTIFIMTTNYRERLDPAICRSGRINVEICFRRCDAFQIKAIYRRMFKREIPEKILQLIPEDQFTPADIIFHCLPFIYTNKTDSEIMARFMRVTPCISKSLRDASAPRELCSGE